jgi:ferric-dicitrate binding protein FerR (iron transport regulator)
MNQDRLDELIDKYAFGTISPEELQELLDWYHSAEIDTVEWPTEEPEEHDHLQERMLMRLQTQIRALPEQPAAPVAEPLVIPIGASSGADGADHADEVDRADAAVEVSGARRRIFRLGPWQVAACLAILFSSIWIARQYPGLVGTPALVEVRNPSGKIRAIRLPDSSEVWLNAASAIRYSPDFGKEHDAPREVYLEGEGYFDVAQDPAHSFIVHAGSLTTTVLGTRFDVKSFSGERQATVSVISGKVSVRDSARVLDVLTAARQLQVDRRTGMTTTVSVDTGQVVGWRQGKLQFSGQTMEEITASLGRWYNVQFVFADPAISRCRYYLNFENTIPLQQMLTALKETTDLSFREDPADHTVTISGNGCN